MRKITANFSMSAMLALCAGTAVATGPIEQNSSINGIPRLLSHVQIRNDQGKGSGTIIDKKIDSNGDAWVCVLTADHVVRDSTGNRIDIGSGTVQSFGAAGSFYLSASANVVGRDMAVMGIKLGNFNNDATAANYYNAVRPVNVGLYGPDYNPAAPRSVTRTIFTEHGYGRQASFTDGGMTAGVFSTDVRRFQDNQVERWRHVTETNYDYYAVEWDFNIPSNAGPLLSEGLSFVGDSGGAYCTEQLETKGIISAFRQNIHENRDGTGSVIPEVPANSQLGLWVDNLVAIHTSGSSNGRTFNPFTTYDANGNPIAQNIGGVNDYSWGAGVPMTADAYRWVQDACNVVPSPSVGTLGLLGGLVAVRRRR